MLKKGHVMSAPYSSKAVANEFIELAKADGRGDLSPMKLQKLVYFAHAWHLAFHEDPLIREEIQAWRFGPVVPEVYHEFKNYGNASVSRLATDLSFEKSKLILFEPRIDKADTKTHELIKEIWRVYGIFSPVQLSNLTHAEGSPWSDIALTYGAELPRNIDIPNELIKERFKAKVQEKKA